MNTILYTNHCVKCNILKELLDKNNIEYVEEDDINVLIDMGFTHMPMLKIEDKCMTFKEALDYVNNY